MKPVRKKPLDRRGKVKVGKALIGVWEDRRRPRPFVLNDLRFTEVCRVIMSRHGQEVPETDDADLYFMPAAFSLSARFDALWVQSWAPWASYEVDIRPILEMAAMRKYIQSADDCAAMLNVTLEDRSRLGLTTIGACDVDRGTRRKIAQDTKRERDRARARQKRRDQGKKPREGYESESLAAQAPWEREGVSRRTWYRRKKATETARGTSPSRPDIYSIGDKPVPPVRATLATGPEEVEREARTHGDRGRVPDGEPGSAPPQKGQANAR